MKTVFTSHEIAHVWANKSAPHGKSPGAVSFDGPAIYSYGTVIARHIEHKGKPAVIYNATSYSNSTAKHQGRIRSAIAGHNFPVFRISAQPMGASLRLTADELFAHYVERAALQEKQALLPRIRQTTRDSHKAQAATYLESAKAVATFFGLRKKVDEKAVQRLAASKAKAEKRAAAERAKREAAQMDEYRDAYQTWLVGGDTRENYFPPTLFPVAFRVEGDELVSTMGARVPLRAAQVAFRFAMSKRGTDWRENGETCPVGHYRLNAINAHGIVAGCHRISWEEIERLAPILSAQTVTA